MKGRTVPLVSFYQVEVKASSYIHGSSLRALNMFWNCYESYHRTTLQHILNVNMNAYFIFKKSNT
jgi:hypothetical protein